MQKEPISLLACSNEQKTPLDEIRHFPDQHRVEKMTDWLHVAAAKIVTDHCPGFAKFKKHIR